MFKEKKRTSQVVVAEIISSFSLSPWLDLGNILYKGNPLSTGNPDHLWSQERGSNPRQVTNPLRHLVSEDPSTEEAQKPLFGCDRLFFCSTNTRMNTSSCEFSHQPALFLLSFAKHTAHVLRQ